MTTLPQAGKEGAAVRAEAGAVWVEFHGRTTEHDPAHTLASIEVLLASTGLHRVVFDLRAAALNYNEMQLVERVRDVDDTQHLRQCAVAMLVQTLSPRYKFLEAAARLAGHNLRLFTDGESALRWLAGEKPATPQESSAHTA